MLRLLIDDFFNLHMIGFFAQRLISSRSDPCVKINGFGQAEILKPDEISKLFNQGFVKSRDRALFGICLYTAARIYKACTLLKGDVISPRGVRPKLIIRSHNSKGSQAAWFSSRV